MLDAATSSRPSQSFSGTRTQTYPQRPDLDSVPTYTGITYPHKKGDFGPGVTCWVNWATTGSLAGGWLLDRGSLVWKQSWPTPLPREDLNKRLKSDIKRVGCERPTYDWLCFKARGKHLLSHLISSVPWGKRCKFSEPKLTEMVNS